MDSQDKEKNASENLFKKIFSGEQPLRSFLLDNGFGTMSAEPLSIDQEASVVFARTFFSQYLEDAAIIMRLGTVKQ